MQPTDRRAWGYFLKQVRTERGLSGYEVADVLGVSEPSVSRWETSTEPPHVKYIPAIIDFLGFVPWCRTPYQSSLGESVKAAREIKGYTQRALQQAAGVNQATIVYIERGTTNPRPFILQRLERALKISLRFGRSYETNQPQPTSAPII